MENSLGNMSRNMGTLGLALTTHKEKNKNKGGRRIMQWLGYISEHHKIKQ
jgi:hypothetical protein